MFSNTSLSIIKSLPFYDPYYTIRNGLLHPSYLPKRIIVPYFTHELSSIHKTVLSAVSLATIGHCNVAIITPDLTQPSTIRLLKDYISNIWTKKNITARISVTTLPIVDNYIPQSIHEAFNLLRYRIYSHQEYKHYWIANPLYLDDILSDTFNPVLSIHFRHFDIFPFIVVNPYILQSYLYDKSIDSKSRLSCLSNRLSLSLPIKCNKQLLDTVTVLLNRPGIVSLSSKLQSFIKDKIITKIEYINPSLVRNFPFLSEHR